MLFEGCVFEPSHDFEFLKNSLEIFYCPQFGNLSFWCHLQFFDNLLFEIFNSFRDLACRLIFFHLFQWIPQLASFLLLKFFSLFHLFLILLFLFVLHQGLFCYLEELVIISSSSKAQCSCSFVVGLRFKHVGLLLIKDAVVLLPNEDLTRLLEGWKDESELVQEFTYFADALFLQQKSKDFFIVWDHQHFERIQEVLQTLLKLLGTEQLDFFFQRGGFQLTDFDEIVFFERQKFLGISNLLQKHFWLHVPLQDLINVL